MKPSLALIPLLISLFLPVACTQKLVQPAATPLEGDTNDVAAKTTPNNKPGLEVYTNDVYPEEVYTTSFGVYTEDAKGAHLRHEVNHAVELAGAKKFPEAEHAAVALQKQFETLFDSRLKQYSFQSKEEYLEFKSTSTQAFEWIDGGYQACLLLQAFIASERQDFPLALSILTSLEAVAPVSAGPFIERGYILNRLGQPEEAWGVYKRALSLSTQYPSQRPFQAAALRGIGFSLIELQKLDEAESVFQESLKIEPGNEIALKELAYIRILRSKK